MSGWTYNDLPKTNREKSLVSLPMMTDGEMDALFWTKFKPAFLNKQEIIDIYRECTNKPEMLDKDGRPMPNIGYVDYDGALFLEMSDNCGGMGFTIPNGYFFFQELLERFK